MTLHAYDALSLVPTASKTSSYTAAVNDLVIVDGTSSSVAITLPTAPPDLSTVGVKRWDATYTATHTPIVVPGGSDAFLGGSTTAAQLPLQGQVFIFQYSASLAQWIVRGELGLSNIAGTTPAANTLAEWDSNANLSANTFLQGVTSTATAAGTTTLTIASSQVQVFTGSTTQTVKLPTTGVTAGQKYTIINQSSGNVSVQSSAGTGIILLGGSNNYMTTITALVNTPTAATDWSPGLILIKGKGLVVFNTLTFAGTDGTVMTFPSTSATIARTDAANTFAGHQTIEGVTSTGATGTGKFVFDTSPTLVTPALGTPTSGTLTNCTGLPLAGLATNLGNFNPSDYGWISWAYDPQQAYLGNLITAGTAQFVMMPIRQATTITNVILNVNVAGSGLTSGQCFAGLFNSSGTLLSATANQSTNWQSAGLQVMTLSTPQSVSAGLYYVGWYANGTTMPKFNYSNVINPGVAIPASLFSSLRSVTDTSHTGLTTAFTSPATLTNASSFSYWAAMS